LRWTTISPPDTAATADDPATIDIAFLGTSRLFTTCGNAELDLQVRLRSDSGVLDITVPAVLKATTSRLDDMQVTATFPLDTLPKWSAVVQSFSRPLPRAFQLRLGFFDGIISGEFAVLAPRTAQCALARFPTTTQCEPGERSIPGDQLIAGLRAQYVLDALPAVEAAKNLFWEDTRTITQVSLDFTSASNEACVIQGPASTAAGTPTYQYGLLGQVRVTTADRRVDITLPARAETLSGDGDWSPVVIRTSTPALIDPKQASAFDFKIGASRVLPTFSSSQVVAFESGAIVDQGILHIEAIDLKSPDVKPTGVLCAADDFLGTRTPITTGEYIAEGQKVPSL